MQDLVDLHLRVPLEKEIPVAVGPQGPERAQGDEEFPEITEVGLGASTGGTSGGPGSPEPAEGNINRIPGLPGVPGIWAQEQIPVPCSH